MVHSPSTSATSILSVEDTAIFWCIDNFGSRGRPACRSVPPFIKTQQVKKTSVTKKVINMLHRRNRNVNKNHFHTNPTSSSPQNLHRPQPLSVNICRTHALGDRVRTDFLTYTVSDIQVRALSQQLNISISLRANDISTTGRFITQFFRIST